MPIKRSSTQSDNERKISIMDNRYVTETGCWNWLGAKSPNGYGVLAYKDKPTDRAHRVSWRVFKGPIPRGLFVLHKCDNRSCVNPDHLFLGTQKENMEDCVRKDRHSRGSRNGQAVLTEDTVTRMRAEHASGLSQKELAQRYGVRVGAVSRALRGERWKHLTGPTAKKSPRGHPIPNETKQRVKALLSLGRTHEEVSRLVGVSMGTISLIRHSNED